MENDIVVYTVTYVTTRVAVLIGFGYAFYHFLCPHAPRLTQTR